MSSDEIRKHMKAIPFRRFVLNIADGRRIPVVDRDFIIMSPSGRVVEVWHKDDTSDYLDTLLITGLSSEAPPAEVASKPSDTEA